MKQQQQVQLRWFDAIPTGFVVAMIVIWYFDLAPDRKWGLTLTGWIVSFASGAVCGAIAYLWNRSRQSKS